MKKLESIDELTVVKEHHEWAKEMLRNLLTIIDTFEAGQPLDWEGDVAHWRQQSISHLQQTSL